MFREIVEKTEYYHSLRRVRAPKFVEEGIAAQQAEAQASPNQNAIEASPPNRPPPLRESRGFPDPIPSLEFKNFTFIPEVQYYAVAARPSQSPQSSEASQAHNTVGDLPPTKMTGIFQNCDNNVKVDIDWVSQAPDHQLNLRD